MPIRSFIPLLVLFVLGLGIAPLPAIAGGPGTTTPLQNAPSREEENRSLFTDLKVFTHEGEEKRFYSDLLKDKVVVISFFYTNCPTAQMSLVTLFKLQKLLGDQLGTEVYLLSLSVDPERDTPKAVQEYAARFNPKKGWVFLTGTNENLEVINQKLGNRSPIPESHLRVFLLGNLRTGQWMRLPETAHAYSVAEGLRTLSSEK